MREKTIDYVLRATWIAVAKMYNEEASKQGSTMATGFALLNIDPDGGTPSTSLGPKMGMEATSLSRTLKSMQEKGLIIRKKNPDDGRSVLIQLTDYGKEMRTFSKGVVLQFDDAIKESVPQEDIKTFIEVANTIMDLINNKKIYKQDLTK
jgi:DNA-binding MarR family transcriptional regulator